jgi:sulfide:quinone oxidoreductase
MAVHHVVVLGAGFGGLELATRLDELAGDAVRTTLVDRSDRFVAGLAKFDLVFGRRTRAEIGAPIALRAPSATFRHEPILAIEPERRRVRLPSGELEADTLVIALGAVPDPSLTPGLLEGGHEFYTVDGAERLAAHLPEVDAGEIVIAILGAPYKCPPAPFELAFQLHDHLLARGRREAARIRVLSPGPVPLPVSPEGSASILERFAARGIEFAPGHHVVGVDGAAGLARLKEGDPIRFDHLLAVPRHRVPTVVAEAGLAPGGWIAVDRATLATAIEGVYAIGDVTAIPVGSAAIPKAGAFAEAGGRAVAEAIAHRLTGRGEPGRFEPRGTCFLEFGAGEIAGLTADYSGEAPSVRFREPTADLRAERAAFEPARRARWFAA